MTRIEGTCDERFEAVREVFAAHFERGEEVGAAVSVVIDGCTVVDLWAGHADQARTRPWERDTLVNVYSTTKGMAALCLLQLVEQGRVDLDAPVARYWPEFAAAGKEAIPVRWLLSHRAGLAAVRKLLPAEALYDWDAMVAALAEETPWWTPGERHGYHAITFGWLVGEVVRRVTGRSLGCFFRDEIAGPLAADFAIGLPDEEHGRVAEMGPMAPPATGGPNLVEAFTRDPEGVLARAFMNPPGIAAGPNHPSWRRAEIPGANGHASARGIARIYGVLARGGAQDGVHVLSRETMAAACEEQSRGPDAVLAPIETRIGLGFMLPQPARDARFGPSESAFGHPGAGGSIGFADPDAKLGFGYAMNKMGPSILVDARALALIDAAYEGL